VDLDDFNNSVAIAPSAKGMNKVKTIRELDDDLGSNGQMIAEVKKK
jgi:hypothetical protein